MSGKVLPHQFDVAKPLSYESDKLIDINYESLVAKPWTEAAKIIRKISGEKVSEALIEKGYFNNQYRKNNFSRIKPRGVNKYGLIKDANDKLIPEFLLAKKMCNG